MSQSDKHRPASCGDGREQHPRSGHAGGACGNRVRRYDRLRRAAAAPDLHVRVSRLRREARLRLHPLGQPDARPAGRCALGPRAGRGRGRHRERHGRDHRGRLPRARGRAHRGAARLLRRHLPAVRRLAQPRRAAGRVHRFRRRGRRARRAVAARGAGVDRDAEQPAAAHHRHRRRGRARTRVRRAGGRRQHLSLARLAAPAHPRGRSRGALHHQVPERPQRRGRRGGGRARPPRCTSSSSGGPTAWGSPGRPSTAS